MDYSLRLPKLCTYYSLKFLNPWENYGPGSLNDLLNLRVYPP